MLFRSALEPHHCPVGPGMLDQQPVDVLLGAGMQTAALFAHIDPNAVFGRVAQELRVGEIVIDHTMCLIGEEHLPSPEGRYLFVSNHPLGGLDGICLTALLGKRYGEQIRCLVNDLLLFIPNLRSLFIPINKHGAQTKEAAIQLNEAFASDCQILTFPAGLCSRKQNGRIEDTEWKKSFVRNAVKYHRDVVPVFFEGRNSD